jgi:DNA polymerase-3 subunit delta'
MRFADIAGHDVVVARLRRAIAADRLAHAYLFAGPAGVGKAATAHALATTLLCEAGGDDACARCPGCIAAARAAHPDLTLVGVGEGATEIKIDQARELQRRLRLRPLRARRTVAIVDDADRLNLAAQHAMLKTFEEPPGAAVLVLVAANVAALLPTVLSRCQRIDFCPLPDEIVTRLLVERCDVPPEEAREMARYGDGSLGEARLVRAELAERARVEMLPLLDGLAERPYADVARLAQEWGRLPLPDLLVLLRAPLAWYRRRLAETLAAGGAREQRVALAELGIVYDAVTRLRRNAHRQLTLDAMLLGLQDAARAGGGGGVSRAARR